MRILTIKQYYGKNSTPDGYRYHTPDCRVVCTELYADFPQLPSGEYKHYRAVRDYREAVDNMVKVVTGEKAGSGDSLKKEATKAYYALVSALEAQTLPIEDMGARDAVARVLIPELEKLKSELEELVNGNL